MAKASENKITVLSQKDPNIPDFLDFKTLRKEGLEHIGALSGKIWTDHNAHDPGITILEVLVYALMDLGYKTNLPFKDLIALKDESDTDDNFLTPLEILTVNPVTITDYRKLLLEIKGVRNAWLEPTHQEVKLYIDEYQNQLNCKGGGNTRCPEIELNGLYKVYIEKDIDIIQDNRNEKALIKEVKSLLAAHRNLCEDFVEDVCVLQPHNIGVCAEVEIKTGYDPERIYAQIIKRTRDFIQPKISYYTLKELLNKGKTIDEIFAGRPYLQESFGFVDTEELENIENRDEIYVSDLYSVILSIEGVLRVKKAHFKGGSVVSSDEYCKEKGDSSYWSTGIKISKQEVPVFSLKETCIDLYSAEGFIPLNTSKIHQTFSFAKKFHLPDEELDNQIPLGRYREDLKTFESIQNDFPVVYGIGEDGLSDNATLLRKTQALQLKGYLMFYDQMLANYTAQLSQIRSLFALTPEADKEVSAKRTYFTDLPQEVPGLEEVLQLYEENEQIPKGARLAIPVARDTKWHQTITRLQSDPRSRLTIENYCDANSNDVGILTFSSSAIRTIYIHQLIDAFFSNNYTIEVLHDRGGYFFTLCPDFPGDVVLVGIQRYATHNDAVNGAKNVAFLCALKETYSVVSDVSQNNANTDQHYFNLSYNPVSYINLIQSLTETPQEYVERRKQFLDHLLARFGEKFTDYAILQYQNKVDQTNNKQQTIADQSSYINKFAEVSRNRAKAFDYTNTSWNTNNVSGFEKRISLLSGVSNYNRRNLCNFEVVRCYRLQLKGPKGNVFFRSNRSYQSKDELSSAAEVLLQDLRDSKKYTLLEKRLNGFKSEEIQRLFSKKPEEENIIPAQFQYHQQLLSHNGDVVIYDQKVKLKSNKEALDKKDHFIDQINAGTQKDKDESEFRLLPLSRENRYINTKRLNYHIDTLISWKWHKYEEKAKKKVKSDLVFKNQDKAWQHLIDEPESQKCIVPYKQAFQWELIIKGNILLKGIHCYADKNRAVAIWRQAKMLGSDPKNYTYKEKGNTVLVFLKNEKGKNIAVSNPISKAQLELGTLIEEFAQVCGNRNTKPKYEKVKEKYGFSIKKKDNASLLMSYCCYDSEEEALQCIGEAFEQGKQKKNFLKSGDEGNPEYNFILRDKFDTFLALPPDHLETVTDRDKALEATTQFLKKNEVPVLVKEEPRRYVWTLLDEDKKVLKSTAEFSSKLKAQNDFDTTVMAEANQGNLKVLIPHCYEFRITDSIARYNYVFGASDHEGRLHPVFRSKATYVSKEEASNAYESFVEKLPALQFKAITKKGSNFDFALYENNKTTPLAIQYKKGNHVASLEEAKETVGYLQKVYTRKGEPNKKFIADALAEHPRGKYEWRFYKKNSPLARNPKQYTDKDIIEKIKSEICDVIPPVTLKECPSKKKAVQIKQNQNLYHYQVCFKDDKGDEFILNSYKGYNSCEEAEIAYDNHWLDIIDIARDITNYGEGRKISVEEVYKKQDSSVCDDISFIAVIPEAISKRVKEKKGNVEEFYVKLARLFPLFKVENNNDEVCNTKYKYRVVRMKKVDNPTHNYSNTKSYREQVLWESVSCYNTIEEVKHAYQHFYTLAGTPNNCRVLCENGKYYVGLIEVLVESSCDFESEEQAWDDAFPDPENLRCGTCVPKGVREFVYAAEEDKNYIAYCDREYWKFKVVSPDYFVADHNCNYDSEKERNEQKDKWNTILKTIDWTKYITKENSRAKKNSIEHRFLTQKPHTSEVSDGFSIDFCDFVQNIRDCLQCIPDCLIGDDLDSDVKKQKSRLEEVIDCLKKIYKDNKDIINILENGGIKLEDLQRVANYFPVYKTDKGYCYQLYWPTNDQDSTPDGLQPCGCSDEIQEKESLCNNKYVFVSSNYYSCCEEALKAFVEFCNMSKNGWLTIECTQKTPYGPFSFQLVDLRKKIGDHPQQYNCLQEVTDAIEITKQCVQNTGMHLLEHILLRPKSDGECNHVIIDANGERQPVSCLLPICPDYGCKIDWYPDMDKDDPCAESNPDELCYIPGSDPYSFWATMVLPAWDKRFRTAEARKAFEQLIYKEVPALVGINIVWLSPRDLCKFEDAYRVWLEWEVNKDPKKRSCGPDDLSPTCRIVECIKNLVSEPPCATIPGAEGDCNCEPEDDKESTDPCCLPIETEGSLFWGYCPGSQMPQDNIPGTVSSGLETKTASAKTKPKVKSTNKKVTPKKKTTVKKTAKNSEKEVLALVRQRKPRYLENIEVAANDSIRKTKSYERVQFFIKNAPTINGYVQLANFFSRYSLQKDNNLSAFLELIKNATWHILDALVLDKKAEVNKEDLDALKKSFQRLKSKGLSLKEVTKNWKQEEIKTLTNLKTVKQIKSIIK
ncbi:hypothetical protein [Aquimarina sediminis]|uniref:hypothetical protein n=1 Tax=Aquimarina sediminis TaxID=2070536 RepID=UPI000CA08C95|nr:hypothetical protein [Aquimarina sediminis]